MALGDVELFLDRRASFLIDPNREGDNEDNRAKGVIVKAYLQPIEGLGEEFGPYVRVEIKAGDTVYDRALETVIVESAGQEVL